MKIYEATEQAYKNGYEDGKRDAVKHGRWIPKSYDYGMGGFTLFHCSECDTPNAFERNYCYNCGAKMDGDGDG